MKIFFTLFFALAMHTPSFEIIIENIEDRESPIYLLVFTSPEGFPYQKEMGVFSWQGLPKDAENGIKTNLPSGTYAVVVFQDTDGNGRLTKWFFGSPREPYGVTNALHRPKRKPEFQKSSLFLSQSDTISIILWNP